MHFLWSFGITERRCQGPCLTTAICRCQKHFNQWQCSFQRKLRSHWLKFLRRRHVAAVRQGPAVVEVMAYRLFGPKRLSEPTLIDWQLVPVEQNCSDIWIKLQSFSFTNVQFEIKFAKCQPFYSDLNMLMDIFPFLFVSSQRCRSSLPRITISPLSCHCCRGCDKINFAHDQVFN